MVREARFQDIPRLCQLIDEAHKKSKYSAYRLDQRKFKDLCMESIRSGNGCLFVSEVKGVVEGLIIGMVDDLYHVLKAKYATDIVFVVSERDKTNVSKLLDAFIAWGRTMDVVKIRMGCTDAIGDFNRTIKLYERKGMHLEGMMFEMEIVT